MVSLLSRFFYNGKQLHNLPEDILVNEILSELTIKEIIRIRRVFPPPIIFE